MEASLATLSQPAGRDPLDLSRATFVTPCGLVALAAIAHGACGPQFAGGQVQWPQKSDVAHYVDRMDLPRMLRSAGCSAPPLRTVNRQSLGDRLVELHSVSGGDDEIEHLADLVARRVSRNGAPDGRMYDDLFELCLNVIEHANSEGAIAAQVYPTTSRLVAAIGDWGQGIRSSLAAAGHHYADDHDAITAAATTQVTSKPGNRGGMGLMSVLGSVRWACSNANRAGHMEVWSGDWRLRFDHRSTDSASYASKARRLRGTIVLLDLPVA